MLKAKAAIQKNLHYVAGAGLLVGLVLAAMRNYLLFHSAVELFSIVVGCSIFLITWNARQYIKSAYFLALGVAYFFVSGVDLIHTLAYPGMAVFEAGGYNLATQLWIAARSVESLSILLAFLFLKRQVRIQWFFAGHAVVFCLALLAIFVWRVFPMCFDEQAGRITTLKKSG
ncbi:MAG: MASE3 domain-containing protein, partial [Planctomycetota bacterium]